MLEPLHHDGLASRLVGAVPVPEGGGAELSPDEQGEGLDAWLAGHRPSDYPRN